jgi:transcriptional regulator
VHPNSAFRWDDRAALRGFAEAIGFGMLFAPTPDGPRVAHVPLVFLDEGRIGFHIARGNGIAKHLNGSDALLVVNGPDGYVSPEWYQLDNNQVPTWNYLAAEFEGPVKRMETGRLIAQIDALTAAQESQLAPKPVWTRDKMDEGRFEKMLGAIQGFELRVTGWRGTAKLSQNKPEAARLSAAGAAEAAGNCALAHLMRELPNG